MPRPPQAHKHRGFCFTLNNPTLQETQAIRDLTCTQYVGFGLEVGECGTQHLQGYIHFKFQKTFSAAKSVLPRAHVEPRKGSIDQAIDYCKKDGIYEEFGTRPSSPAESGNKSLAIWKEILSKAKAGEMGWIEENYPKVWINTFSKLQALQKPKTEIINGELQHEWWFGDTGTGKSRTVWELYPEHYQKELNKWWCGYENESIVVIEEWSPKNECTGSQLKIWADRYPFTGQIKGGSLKKIRPTKIIVLSNYTIAECFPMGQDKEPLLRRFKQLRFPEDLNTAVQRSRAFVNAADPDASDTDTTLTINEGDWAPFNMDDELTTTLDELEGMMSQS